MKKNYPILTVTLPFILILFALMTLFTSNLNGQSDTKSAQYSNIPEDISKVFEKSCMSCHSTGGKFMAMSHLNFSKWNTYKPEKMVEVASDICKMLSTSKMPPKSFKISNPDAIPTQDQIKSICLWSETLRSDLKK